MNQAMKRVSDYLSDKKITWIELLLLFAIGIIVYSRGLENVEFYQDENPWIYESTALNSFLAGNFDQTIWLNEYNGMLDPPVAKYIIGIGMNLSGLSINSFTRWNWMYSIEENLAKGGKPSKEILWWARIPMVVVSVLGLLFATFLLGVTYSRAAALLFFIFCMTKFTSPLQRAMSEPPLIFFTFLAGLIAYRGIKAVSQGQTRSAYYWFSAFGICSGLATASKLNGVFIVFAGILFVVLSLPREKINETKQPGKFVFRISLLQIFLAILMFIAINPFLYTNLLKNTALMVVSRIFTVDVQTKMYSQAAVTPENWLWIVPGRIFGQYSTPYYPAQFIFNLFFFAMGFYKIFRVLRLKLSGWEGSIVLCCLSLVCVGPALFIPLDWERYYVYPVLFARMFIAVGIIGALSDMMRYIKHYLNQE
jgi:hypothetical protein